MICELQSVNYEPGHVTRGLVVTSTDVLQTVLIEVKLIASYSSLLLSECTSISVLNINTL